MRLNTMLLRKRSTPSYSWLAIFMSSIVATTLLAQEPPKESAPPVPSESPPVESPPVLVQEPTKPAEPNTTESTAVQAKDGVPAAATPIATESNAAAEQTKQDEQEQRPNPCDEDVVIRAWIDRLHSSLYRLTCSSASWFDGLFGDGRYDDAYRETYGSVTVGGRWSQRDSFNKTLRFKARLNLPQLNERFHAFIGRDDRNEFLTESQANLYQLPDRFNRNADDQVFLGLGYSDRMHKYGNFDTDVGVRLDFPVDPYVKGRYRFARPIGESTLLRLRETLFWQKTERWGETTVFELDRILSKKYLARWTNSGTYSQNSVGLRWFSNVTLYQLLNENRAFAYEISANGNTDSLVPLADYGVAVIYRQRIWREWLVMELRTGVDWPRLDVAEERHSNLNVGLSFEMKYGRQ